MRTLRLAIQDGVTKGRVRFRRKLLLFVWQWKFGPAEKKTDDVEKRSGKINTLPTWIMNLCFCWRQCSKCSCSVSLLLRLPSIFFCKISSLRWVSWSSIFIGSYVTFVTFFRWPTYTAVSVQRIKFDRNLTSESAVAFLPRLIELNSTRQKYDVWTGLYYFCKWDRWLFNFQNFNEF